MKPIILNQITVWKLTNAIASLSDSTHIRMRVPFGPGIEVNGRNGKRPTWKIGSVSVPISEELDKFFLADNGKYSLVFSPYYVLDVNSLETEIEFTEGILPSVTVFPIFRNVKDVFMFSDLDLQIKFLPNQTVHVYATKTPLLPNFPY